MSRRLLVRVLMLSIPALAQDTPEPPADPPARPEARVVPVFDPGAHTQPIAALGFSADGKRLITVGQDDTIQIWNTTSGERLDLLRVPGYGSTGTRWHSAAVSPDGTRVAIGGEGRALTPGKDEVTHLLVINLTTRAVRPFNLKMPPIYPVHCLAFSPDSDRLVAAAGPYSAHTFINNLDRLLGNVHAPERPRDVLTVPIDSGHRRLTTALAFGPDNKHLIGGDRTGELIRWEDSGGKNKLKVGASLNSNGVTSALAWSPDGKQFVRAFHTPRRADHGIELWNADGTVAKKWTFQDLAPAFVGTEHSSVFAIRFLARDRVLLTGETVGFGEAAGFGNLQTGFGSVAAVLDLGTGKCHRLFGEESFGRGFPLGAVSSDGQFIAMTVSLGTEAVVLRVKDGAVVARCGPRTPVPTHVGWSSDPRTPGFAWGDSPRFGRSDTKPDDLRFGFDLARIEPVAVHKDDVHGLFRQRQGVWSWEYGQRMGNAGKTLRVLQDDKLHHNRSAETFTATTFVPQAEGSPLLVHASHRFPHGGIVRLNTVDGPEKKAGMRPNFPYVRDIAPSPDGRYLIAATGGPALAIIPTHGPRTPMLYFTATRGEWVLWSPEGYYAASPGGERLFGWAVQNGPDKLVDFHPARAFAGTFRRPDLLRRAVQLGSIERALKEVKSRSPQIEEVLPPTASLRLLEQKGTAVRVKAVAVAAPRGKPVVALRLLLDGRPLPAGRGSMDVGPGKPAEAEWEVQVPAGAHELRLLARSDDGVTVSDAIRIRGAKDPASQPTLHRVCIGVDAYDQAALRLTSAAKDARDVFTAFGRDCVGSDNRFGAAKGQLLLDRAATREAVLAALSEVRKAAKPGDLVAVFFAGHGVKQGDEYYLLTREADTTGELKGKSLSGMDLRRALSEFECPVLLMLDACHSAQAVKRFRPATDDATRSLTSDAIGVTVLAAAMSHEVADASSENGFFTAGLLKALHAGAGVPFDPYDRGVYIHHIFAVVFAEVRQASHGKQNPFLNLPTTMPPVILREVPARAASSGG